MTDNIETTSGAKEAARAFAKSIEWDCDLAYDFALELLTDCNMHAEAAALKAEFKKDTLDDK